MKDNDQCARAKTLMVRVVREKIPQADRWTVPEAFKSWIDGLSAEKFQTYSDRLSVLTRTVSDEESPRQAGVFIAGRAYPVGKMEIKQRLEAIGGEATAYYALALWRNLEAEKLRQLDGFAPN